jgi:hypothetical protein
LAARLFSHLKPVMIPAKRRNAGGTIMIANITLAMVAAALGLSVSATLPANAQSLDDIYAKAKSEGDFAFYVGGPTAPWEAMAKVFEQRYPGIGISISGGFSNVLDKKIDQQIAGGKLEVDAAILQTIADFVRWKAEGRLLDFKPNGFDAIDASFKDTDGAFWATMVNAVPYMYNTEKVAAADVPDSALDFLKPQFQGKMVTPYPADDDVTLWVFLSHRAEVRLELYGQIHGREAQSDPGPSRPAAQHRHRAESGHFRFDLQHYRDTEKAELAGRVAFSGSRRDTDLAAHRSDFQGRPASERGEAVSDLAARASATDRHRHLVGTQRCAAANRL